MSSRVDVPPAAGADAGIEVSSSIAALDVEELANRFGTPFFIYDGEVLRARAALLRATLPAEVDIAFATKANPSPAVLGRLARTGLGADVASGAELRAVLRAGFPARQVVFTGPGKTDAELVAAMRAGIGALTIESLDELDAVIALAPAEASTQGLLLRLASSGGAEGRPIIGAPGSAKFGLTDDEAWEAVARLHGSASLLPDGPLRLRGFHAFGASNVRDASVLVAGVADLARRAEAIAAGHGLAIELLDAGGGLGIPYAEGEEPLDLAALGRGLRTELSTWLEREPLRGARLLLEPGRWLTGPAGAYVCRVIRTKEREGRWIAVTDGGIHHLLRPRLVDQDQRVVAVGAAAARPADARIDVVGPLCTGLDYLASGVRAPEPRPGDLLAVLDAGAYGYSESMPFFLSHPIPAELVVDRGAITVSRERIDPV